MLAPMAQVVIVGAGPAGAALSFLLARRGIGVALLERHTDFAREFRGEVLMPTGIDVLGQMGLAGELAAVPQVGVEVVEIFRGTRRLLRINVRQVFGVEGPRITSQPVLLEMLVGAAARFPSFRLERGVTVRDLLRDGDRIVGVRGESTAGTREFRGDLLIGTDGRTSVVRQRAGLHEVRAPQAFDIVWAKVPRPANAEPGVARAFLGRGHFVLAFPTYDERLQIGWVIEKGSFGDLRARGVEGWIAEMADHVSADLATHLRTHHNDITQPFLLDVVCDRLVQWTAPGLLLLGDAAHPMSPVGGQGINIALRDALIAANHLVPAFVQGVAAATIDAAARAVEQERRPEVTAIQELQQVPPRVLFGQTRWSTVVLNGLLPFLARTGIARLMLGVAFRRFARGMSEVRLEV